VFEDDAGVVEDVPHVDPAVPQVDDALELLAGVVTAAPETASVAGASASPSTDATSAAPEPMFPVGLASRGALGSSPSATVLGLVVAARGGGTVRSLMQYRHLMASSWIISAQ
jgi:hypothetical protein